MVKIRHQDPHGPTCTEMLMVADLMADIEELGLYDRARLFDAIRDRYCLGCGDDDPRCQCQNDD